MPRVFAKSKWRIGEPDLKITMHAAEDPGEGFIPYKYVVLPVRFQRRHVCQRD